METHGTIRMLNLFRCSSAENNECLSDINCFVTDYFDGIKVEKLKWEETRLADCMGIKQNIGTDKKGVSHQRYCLYTENEIEEDIFEISEEFPLMTMIQIFINPDMYQVNEFEDGRKMCLQSCIQKVEECIKSAYEQKNDVKWEVYSLLTAGDFAVIVRSKNVHDAYDISTLIRNIRVVAGTEEKEPFFSYSISGIVRDSDVEKIPEAEWAKYLSADDRVIVRMEYSQIYRGFQLREGASEENGEMLKQGYRLLGRYDYQVECTPQEFDQVYPYLTKYKFGYNLKQKELSASEAQENNNKIRTILWLLKNKYVSQINEKLLLKYTAECENSTRQENLWKIKEQTEWKSLYVENSNKISKLKQNAEKLEDKIATYYNYARNLKEYARLMVRACRIFYEINQLRELRVSVAVLIRQFDVFLNSIEQYLEYVKDKDEYKAADNLEDNLRKGIAAIEIFARYIRNINLQTLQTPNYDLQTNVCVEKILLAYSQFLTPFVVENDNINGNEYFSSNTLYPIVVPNTGAKDVSVWVTFKGGQIDAKENNKKMMVVKSPTFMNFCEFHLLIPILFHEIAHQFRYESRKDRNRCLKTFIMKSLAYNFILKILGIGFEYNMESDPMMKNLVEETYQIMEKEMCSDVKEEGDLRFFQWQMTNRLETYVEKVRFNRNNIRDLITAYIEKTKEDTLEYTTEIVNSIDSIVKKLEDWKKPVPESEFEEKYGSLVRDFQKMAFCQAKQLLREIADYLKSTQKIKKDEQVVAEIQKFEKYDKKDAVEDLAVYWLNESTGSALFGLWNRIHSCMIGREDKHALEIRLKKYHNLVETYWSIWRCLQEKETKDNSLCCKSLSEMSSQIYSLILKNLDKYEKDRRRELNWHTNTISTEELETLKRRIKIESQAGMETRIRGVLIQYQRMLGEHVYANTELYREVTSDLFMCGIMGLDFWGYLVIAAEYFGFREREEAGLYLRVMMVLQCLTIEQPGEKLEGEEFDKKLFERLRDEAIKLAQCSGMCDVQIRSKDLKSIDAIEKILNSIDEQKLKDCGEVTGKWILTIYRKIAKIIKKICGSKMSWESIIEEELWEDLTGKKSYYFKKEKLQKILKKEDLTNLCVKIAEMLNSPVDFYRKQESLLAFEIKFIFKHYEDSCMSIWEGNDK